MLYEVITINAQMIKSIEGLENVTINNLYNNYPDFFIDVNKEQDLLTQHDLIIWHHPFYWYSAPSILKEWFDLVLEHGFAFGKNGGELKGKTCMNVITTGARKETYTYNGFNRYPLNAFMIPFEQSAHLCQMNYLPPYAVHGSHLLDDNEVNSIARQYKADIIKLRDYDRNNFV